jgi:hypothetical protein
MWFRIWRIKRVWITYLACIYGVIYYLPKVNGTMKIHVQLTCTVHTLVGSARVECWFGSQIFGTSLWQNTWMVWHGSRGPSSPAISVCCPSPTLHTTTWPTTWEKKKEAAAVSAGTCTPHDSVSPILWSFQLMDDSILLVYISTLVQLQIEFDAWISWVWFGFHFNLTPGPGHTQAT